MAKFTPGPTVAAVSGSVGGTTYSRNRYGAYMRFRAVPTNPDTIYQQNARARLASISSDWRGLTAAQRTAWNNWAQTNPIVDALGQPQILQGNAAYIKLNSRIDVVGETHIDTPPIGSPPSQLTSLTLTADIGAGDVQVAFAPSPLGADEQLFIYATVVDSAARKFVSNLFKLVAFSNAADTTPVIFENELVTRFGSLTVGQTVVVRCAIFDHSTGLIGLPRESTALVTTT